MDIFKLVGSIFIKNDDANSQIDSTAKKGKSMAETIGGAMDKAGQKITSIGKVIAPVSVACGAMLTASVKGASDFQNGMAKMSTLFDTTQTSVGDLSKEFLDLSNKTGISATELAEAGYQALSAGQNVDQVGKFVQTAGNLAKAGFTSTSTAVDVLTTAMNAYGEGAGTAEEISNKLVRTQNLGKTTVDELASSMGKIIPTASGMNVNIDNLTAGYVSLTKQGIATAEATTYMNSMMNELGDSGTTIGKVLKEKTGKSFQELMGSGMSLADVLQITKDYATETGTNFNELWGSAEAGKAGIAILNGGVAEFNDTVGIMASKTDDVGEALDKLETPSVKMQKSLNQVKNSGIELGTALLIALAPTIDKVSAGIQKATEWFSGLSDGTKTTIATVMMFVTALAPVLMIGGKIISGIGTFMTWIPKIKTALTMVSGGFKALWGVLMANPIVIVIAVIAGLVAGFIYLWNHCEGFREFWINLWTKIKEVVSTCVDAVVTFFTNLWTKITDIFNSIVSALQTAWNTITNVIQVAIMLIGEIINGAIQIITIPFKFIWENCKNIVIQAWEAIKTAVSTAINAVKTTITTVMNAIKTVFTTVWNAIKSALTPILEEIKSVVTSVWNAIKSVVTSVVNAIKSVVTSVWNTIKSTVTSVMNGIKSVISNVWNSAKSTVSSAINGIKSTISSGLNSAKATVTSVLNAIKNAFSNVMNGAKNVVGNAISAIKSKFNFSWSLPKLKLPHPKISGSFSLNPPSVPHFSIDWYKKAMDSPFLMTKPTIFDMNPVTGKAKAGGEAGNEIMYGHANLMNDIREASGTSGLAEIIESWMNRMFDLMMEYFPQFANMQMVTDTGALVGELAPRMDTALGKRMNHKERGN